MVVPFLGVVHKAKFEVAALGGGDEAFEGHIGAESCAHKAVFTRRIFLIIAEGGAKIAEDDVIVCVGLSRSIFIIFVAEIVADLLIIPCAAIGEGDAIGENGAITGVIEAILIRLREAEKQGVIAQVFLMDEVVEKGKLVVELDV